MITRIASALLLAGCAQVAPAPDSLAGTSWQFVKFQGGDGTVFRPADKAMYTVAFGADGVANVRFDCNLGRGGWSSPGKSQLEFGPMALTRAMCPPGSLHDLFAKHWHYVRSYVIKGGHLYLSLMADGGSFEFEPVPR
jgi:para-nitrobenzyl esterase